MKRNAAQEKRYMAHHRIISQARWLKYQKQEAEYWHGNTVLENRLAYIERHYAPMMVRYAEGLPDEAHVLDLGCGPVCPSRFVVSGNKTYVDPLLDTFRRAYPGKLPKGERLAVPTDTIPKPDASFDMIVSIDALDRVMNPELTLNEARRLLKTDGAFIFGMKVYPIAVAMACYYADCFIPVFCHRRHPYFYAHTGIRKTLQRYFSIVEEYRLPDPEGIDMFGREMAFVCRHQALKGQGG